MVLYRKFCKFRKTSQSAEIVSPAPPQDFGLTRKRVSAERSALAAVAEGPRRSATLSRLAARGCGGRSSHVRASILFAERKSNHEAGIIEMRFKAREDFMVCWDRIIRGDDLGFCSTLSSKRFDLSDYGTLRIPYP
jgi:hypothetical protein